MLWFNQKAKQKAGRDQRKRTIVGALRFRLNQIIPSLPKPAKIIPLQQGLVCAYAQANRGDYVRYSMAKRKRAALQKMIAMLDTAPALSVSFCQCVMPI